MNYLEWAADKIKMTRSRFFRKQSYTAQGFSDPKLLIRTNLPHEGSTKKPINFTMKALRTHLGLFTTYYIHRCNSKLIKLCSESCTDIFVAAANGQTAM